MAEPARKIYDDEPEGNPSSAYERAKKQWGLEDGENQENEPTQGGSEGSARERANQAWGMTPEDLKEAEGVGEGPSASNAEKQELADGNWDTNVSKPETKRSLRNILSTRNGRIGAGLVTAGVAGTIAFTGLLGPNLLVNHLRELLLTRVSQLQTDHSLKYRRKYINRVSDMFTTDGRRGGKVIADMEARGYRFAFDGNKIVGVTPPGATASISGLGLDAHLHDYLELRHPLRTSRWKTKRMEAFYGRYKVSRTPVTTRAPDDPENPEEAVNKKLANDVFGDDVNSETTPRGADGEESEDEAKARNQSNAEHAATTTESGLYDDIKAKLRSGTPLSELTPDERNLLQIADNLDQELIDLLKRASEGSLLSRTFSSMTSLFNVADIGDKICTVRNRLHGIQVAARTFRALSMLRYASSFIKVGDATRVSGTAGRVDPTMLNAVMKRINATDKNGNPLAASPGIAYILKGKFSKSKNDAFKGNFGVDGKLVGFPGAVDGATKNLPGITPGSCSVIQNPVFQVGLGVISIGIGVFTGGSSTAATEGVKQTFTQSLKAGIQSMLTKRVAASILTGIAIDLSFESAMMLVQFYAEKSMALPFTGQEVGGELGDAIAGGAGTLNKQRSLQAGMVPATSQQYAQVYNTFLAEKSQERDSQNFFTRYLDLENTDSFAFQSSTELALATSEMLSPSSGKGAGLSGLVASIMSVPTSSFASLSGALTGRVGAQSDSDEISFDSIEVGGETLATDPAGNLLPVMRTDIEEIDPIENRDYLIQQQEIDPGNLEPLSEEFIEHMEKCVNGVDTLTAIESGEGDCLAKNEITKRYKAHLAYLDMLDGIDAYLSPDEIAAAGSGTAGSAVIPPEGLAWPLIETKAATTENLGDCLDVSTQSICHAGHPYLAHDLFADPGTQVVAVAGGEVIRATNGTCGHGFGSAFSVQVFSSETNSTYYYQHMDPSVGGVTVGTILKPGDPIGVVGSSNAACNTSPHLHIDAVSGRGRPSCSRLSCSSENRERFIDISKALFKGYEVLP